MRKMYYTLIIMLSTVIYTQDLTKNESENENVIQVPKEHRRGDNYIDTKVLHHEENSKYRIDNGNTVRILFETRNNDLEEVDIIYNNKKIEMNSMGNDNGIETFYAEVPNEEMSYYFEIKDRKLRYFYGEEINEDESKITKYNYTRSYDITNVPDWSKALVGYQIYVDGFRNGNYDNDPIFNEFGVDDFLAPTGELRSGTPKKDLVSANWGEGRDKEEFSTQGWTENYEKTQTWEENGINDLKSYTRYYGGDIQGIKEKIDYLKNLGVDYLILSPVFYSNSNHKYNSTDLRHVDPFFGFLEQTGNTLGLDIKSKVHNNNGDKELNLLLYDPSKNENILGENLNPETWVWTSSDLELASLLKEAHNNNMRIILEMSPSIVSNASLFNIDSDYKNLFLDKNMKELDLSNSEAQNYVYNSLKKWILGPDEEILKFENNDGIDGIKFNFYSEKNKSGLSSITKKLKELNSELLILGEYSNEWYEDINIGLFDTGTDYAYANNLIEYLVNTNPAFKIDSEKYASKQMELYNSYSRDKFYSTQIFIDSIDTDRIFSNVINPNRNFDQNNSNNSDYLDIRPDLYSGTAVSKMKQIVLSQIMLPASPVIYYGDEVGMWGSDTPRNRKPMFWDDLVPYEDESDALYKYDSIKRDFPENVTIDEVENKIYYPFNKNGDIQRFYEKILNFRKENKEFFQSAEYRMLEAYDDPETKQRVDSDTTNYINEEIRRAKIFKNDASNVKNPNEDFISYELSDGKKSLIVLLNNSADKYTVQIKAPREGMYRELFSNEKYGVVDKYISVTLDPYESKAFFHDGKFRFNFGF